MKKIFFTIATIILVINSFSNNVVISNVATVDANNLSFEIQWDNSWYTSLNYDAVWVFVKVQDCAGTSTWDHLNLSTTSGNHVATGGTGLYVEASTDGKGVFVRRNSNGFGTQSATITLRFASSISNYDDVNYHVNGVEMVWIPTASFYVGDGSTVNTAGSGSAYNYGTNSTTAPFLISSENQIASGAFSNPKNNSTCNSPNDYNVSFNPTIPASYPKGYQGFYCMKYEISQGQYAAFLNDLTSSQQGSRSSAPPTSTSGTYAMTSTSSAVNRNSIVIKTPANSTATAVYDCNLNGDGTYGDGADIACNYLSWDDIAAYLDWSGLRPLTELEYEKVCRGPNAATVMEYPWGNNVINSAVSTSLNNAGSVNETSTSAANGLCAFSGTSSDGPIRCGFAATSTSGRTEAGSGFYGVFDMGGNVWEQCINTGWQWYSVGCIGSATNYPAGGLIFNGSCGDGNIDIAGNDDVTTWGNSRYTILKGGAFNTANNATGLRSIQTSDRSQVFNLGNYLNNNRHLACGGRGCRRP